MQIIIRITILIQIINCMTSYSMLRKLPRFVALSRASLSQFVQPSIDNSSWKKRVVAMVVGYVGSSYHGLQMTDPILSTVEKELEMALYSVGSIIPSNHGDLSKIGWSRSSRTDRGVHAARLVISAKLELDPLWEYNMSDFVRKVNEVLPEDIRLYSCLRVNKGFRARESCHWREYEYLLPLSAAFPVQYTHKEYRNNKIGQKDEFATTYLKECSNATEFCDRLNTVFHMLEGSNSLHNFHRGKDKKAKSKKWRNQSSAMSSNNDVNPIPQVEVHEEERETERDDEDEDGVEDDEEMGGENKKGREGKGELEERGKGGDESADGAGAVIDTTSTRNDSLVMKYHFNNWMAESPRHTPTSSLYRMHASLMDPSHTQTFMDEAICDKSTGGVVPFISIAIRGQGFLMHQIRIMIGAAMLYARGIIPLNVIQAAIEMPYQVKFPLAPYEGLVLVDSGYSRNINKQDYALRRHTAEDDSILIMMDEESHASEQFRYNNIYRQIVRDWTKNSHGVLWKWFDTLEQYRVSEGASIRIYDTWQEWKLKNIPLEHEKHRRATARIEHEIQRYNEYKLSKSAVEHHRRGFASTVSSGDSKSDRSALKKKTIKLRSDYKVPHSFFLPNGFPTALVVRHKILSPRSEKVKRITQAIATKICRSEMPYDLSANELCDLMDKQGDLEFWLQAERCVLID